MAQRLKGAFHLKFPRLVLADERKNERTPPSVVLLASMKRAGVPLRVFYCGLNSADICMLKNAVEEDITVLHPKTSANPKIMKMLFELAASPDKLNVIVCELGRRGETYIACSQNPQVSDMAAAFDCSVVLCCYAESVPSPAAKMVMSFVEAIEGKNPNVRVDGIVFINPFDQRSFQLVENSVGMQFKGLSFGYIPQELEPPMPRYDELCSIAGNSKATFLLRAVTVRISKMHDQIDFPAIEAIGRYCEEWTPAGKIEPIKRSSLPSVAIIDDIALSSEGNNAELLFRAFGCKVEKVPFFSAFSRNYDIFYFPHGLGYKALANCAGTAAAVNAKAAFLSNKIIFANGASSGMFAKKIVLPDGSEMPGIGVLPGVGTYYDKPDESIPSQCESMSNGIMLQYREKIGGYVVPWAKLSQSGSTQKIIANWLCSPMGKDGAVESAGWESGGGIFAGAVLDLWSNTDAVRRIFYAKV